MDERCLEIGEVALPCTASEDLHRHTLEAGPLAGTYEDQKGPAGRSQSRGDPTQGKALVHHPVQRIKGDDGIKLIKVGHRAHIAELEAKFAGRRGDRDHSRRRIQTDDIGVRKPACDLCGDPAVSTSNVQQAVDSVEVEPIESAIGHPLLQVTNPPVLTPIPIGHPAAIAWVREHHPTVGVVEDANAMVRTELDVYAPCALGGALDDEVAETLQASIVCGGANNQLAHDRIDNRLAERGIIYCPDYLVNAGGVIQVADELNGFSFARAKAKATGIHDVMLAVLRTADAEGITPSEAADRLAERRMAAVAPAERIWTGR